MRIAVVISNFGSPNVCLPDVRRFLFKLFSDPRIIPLPSALRYGIACAISVLRARSSLGKYRLIIDRADLMRSTYRQSELLENALRASALEAKVFTFMRYTSPSASEVVRDVLAYTPDKIVFLPLYPQKCAVTTQSSLDVWQAAKQMCGLNAPEVTIEHFYSNKYIVEYYVSNLTKLLRATANPLVLFVAHSVPQRLIAAGDPYQKHVERMAQLVASGAQVTNYLVTYQSKIGRKGWLEPSIEEIIGKTEYRNLIVVPVSFVNENLETVYDLDINAKQIAHERGIELSRVMAIETDELLTKALAEEVIAAVK